MSDVTPQKFGEKYILLDRIGTGGVAEVFCGKLTRDQGFEKLIVIKKLLAEHNRNREMINIFIREARLAALLEHENIAATYDFGEIDGEYFLAMEYLFGKNLHAIMARAGEHPEQFGLVEALAVCSKICEGMDYAHKLRDLQNKPLNLVHRDLTPHNIFVTYDGKVKILDFGVAKAELFDNKTREGVVKGKISYMSPERLSGESVDQRSDIFSIGILLYEMIAKKRMYHGDTAELIRKCLTADYQSLKLSMPELEPGVHAILDRALAVGLEDRYQSCGEMLSDIDDLQFAMQQRSNSRLLKESVGSLFAEEYEVERQKVGSILHLNKDGGGAQAEKSISIDRRGRDVAAADKTTVLLRRPPKQVVHLYAAKVGTWIRQLLLQVENIADGWGIRPLYLGVCAGLLLLVGVGIALFVNDDEVPEISANLGNKPIAEVESGVSGAIESGGGQSPEEPAGQQVEADPSGSIDNATAETEMTVPAEDALPAPSGPGPEQQDIAAVQQNAANDFESTDVVEQTATIPVLKGRELKRKKELSVESSPAANPPVRQIPAPVAAVRRSASLPAQPEAARPVDLTGATLGFEEDKARLAQRKQIETLRKKAQEALQQGRLVKPAKQSAYEFYRQILTIDPRDNVAKDGLRLICDKYGELAERALAAEHYVQAEEYVREGLSVIYDHSRLLEIRKRIERERQDHVFELSEKARLCLDADKLSTPVKDSAYFYFSEIERIDPGNETVARGYKKIGDRYAQLGDDAFNRFDYETASRMVEKGLLIVPDHYYLLSLKEDLARSELGRFGHSVKKKMNRLFSN